MVVCRQRLTRFSENSRRVQRLVRCRFRRLQSLFTVITGAAGIWLRPEINMTDWLIKVKIYHVIRPTKWRSYRDHRLCDVTSPCCIKAHTRLPSVGFRSWSRYLAVSLQVTWVINPVVGCHYFLPGLQLPPQPLRGLLPNLLLGEQTHGGCEQFA